MMTLTMLKMTMTMTMKMVVGRRDDRDVVVVVDGSNTWRCR